MNEPTATEQSPPPEGSLLTTPTPTPAPTEPPEPPEPPTPPPAEPEPLVAEDISFPDGFEVDATLRDEFLALANDKDKSPKERAQALVDLQVKAATAASEASSKAWTDMQESWKAEVRADAEIGGAKLDATIGRIGRLIDEYGSDGLREAFDMTGAGNNPAVIRFLAKIADVVTEGPAVPGTPAQSETTAAQRLFPSMKG